MFKCKYNKRACFENYVNKKEVKEAVGVDTSKLAKLLILNP